MSSFCPFKAATIRGRQQVPNRSGPARGSTTFGVERGARHLQPHAPAVDARDDGTNPPASCSVVGAAAAGRWTRTSGPGPRLSMWARASTGVRNISCTAALCAWVNQGRTRRCRRRSSCRAARGPPAAGRTMSSIITAAAPLSEGRPPAWYESLTPPSPSHRCAPYKVCRGQARQAQKGTIHR